MPLTIEPTLGIYRISESVVMPKFETQGAACFDLRYQPTDWKVLVYDALNYKQYLQQRENGELFINPNERVLVPTGIIFDIPEGFSVRIHIRSSMALKLGLSLANSEAVIDSDYTHESFVMLQNNSQALVQINKGDRIAQAELVRNQPVELVSVDRPQQKTDRTGGFGSTGK